MHPRYWSCSLLRGESRVDRALIRWTVALIVLGLLSSCASRQRRDEIADHIDKRETTESVSTGKSAPTTGRSAPSKTEPSSVAPEPGAEASLPSDLPVVVLAPPGENTRKPAPSAGGGGAPVLLRSEVEQAIAAGPGRLLGFLRVRPHAMKRRFLGFEIVEILAPDRRFHPPHLRPGDVILQINGIRMKQPENLFNALQSLRTAAKLEFDIWRAEKRVLVTYTIQDDTGGVASETAP